MQLFLIVLLIIIILLLVVIIAGSLSFIEYAVKRKQTINVNYELKGHHKEVKPIRDLGKKWINSHEIKEESITSFDNLKLVTDILEHKNSKKTVIMMHGFRAQDYDDFALSVKYFYENGFNVLLPYQRAHGKSEGAFLTFGVKERYDCKDWINFAIDRYGKDSEIVLMGVSMGCATVLMTLGFDLPKNVKLCIADCGYTTPRAIFTHVLTKEYHVPRFPIFNLCSFLSKKIADFDIDGYTVKEALENNEIPVLFIHGDKDAFVPEFMTHENYKNCKSEKELLIVPNAEHAVSFLRETELCWNTINKMLEKYIQK